VLSGDSNVVLGQAEPVTISVYGHDLTNFPPDYPDFGIWVTLAVVGIHRHFECCRAGDCFAGSFGQFY
jgi:hypothetical protein